MAKKIILTMPEEFLRAVDAEAEAEHRSRSELVREALRHYLAERGRLVGDRAARQRAAIAKMDEARRLTAGKQVSGSELIHQWRYRLAK